NREIPPLRYDVARRLKSDFPDCVVVLNGGIARVDDALEQLHQFDGIMLGRAAWHDPAVLTQLSQQMDPEISVPDPDQVVADMVEYAHQQVRRGTPLRMVVKPMLGWMSGRPGARRW